MKPRIALPRLQSSLEVGCVISHRNKVRLSCESVKHVFGSPLSPHTEQYLPRDFSYDILVVCLLLAYQGAAYVSLSWLLFIHFICLLR